MSEDLNRITLADLLAEHIGETDDYPDGRAMGEHLLESVEMQAIRKALHRLSVNFSSKVEQETILRRTGLPSSVVAWVLEGEQ